MKNPSELKEIQQHWRGSLASYLIGFLLSLLLTGAAFFIVMKHVLANHILELSIAGLAMIQAIAQLVFFLHLSKESRPRWNILILLITILILAIIVLGSLWIMYNLDERLMHD